jgi:hypothetical protein
MQYHHKPTEKDITQLIPVGDKEDTGKEVIYDVSNVSANALKKVNFKPTSVTMTKERADVINKAMQQAMINEEK